MLIKLKKGTVISGIPNCPVGVPFDVPDRIAEYLVVIGKAIKCSESQRITVPIIEKIETRDPKIENREPEVPVRPRRGRSRLP